MRIDILLITKGRAYCANHDKFAKGKYTFRPSFDLLRGGFWSDAMSGTKKRCAGGSASQFLGSKQCQRLKCNNLDMVQIE